jgi:hypothetical protein
MAELAAQGNLHEVDNAEADQAYEDIKHMIPHNVMIGNLLRNIYPRLLALEKENKSLKKEVAALKANVEKVTWGLPP